MKNNQKQLVFAQQETHLSTEKHYSSHSRNSPSRHSHRFTAQTNNEQSISTIKLSPFLQVTSRVSQILVKFLMEQRISLLSQASVKKLRCFHSSLKILIILSQLRNLHLQTQQVQDDSQTENLIHITLLANQTLGSSSAGTISIIQRIKKSSRESKMARNLEKLLKLHLVSQDQSHTQIMDAFSNLSKVAAGSIDFAILFIQP